jgi:O-acetylhomoserine (thiol)-lyase
MVFSDESTVGAFLLRARREGLRDFGACMSPHTAWLILQGIETLPLRMARHVENTRKVVAFLAGHPMVARVGYPNWRPPQPCAGQAAAAARLRLGVQLRPQRQRAEQGQAFIEALKIFSTWPTWATAAVWSSTRPAPRTSAWTTPRWRPPASRRARSGCRSAWKTPTT